jgi:hypothetical protein
MQAGTGCRLQRPHWLDYTKPTISRMSAALLLVGGRTPPGLRIRFTFEEPMRATCKHRPHKSAETQFPAGKRFTSAWIICAVIFATPYGLGQTRVTTWHYSNTRTSANTTETILTPAKVNVTTFGKLFTQPVDGIIVGQPLYLPGVTIPNNGVHNIVYVATMNDTVYAFDADSGTTSALWQTSLLTYSPAGATPVPVSVKGCAGTVGWTQTGVISTPVIDPYSNTIYLVAETYESQKVVHRLHALNLTNGQERVGSPVTIKASYTLNGVTYTFVDTHQMNRPGLLLANGNIYIAFGSAGCNGGDQGWVMAYDKSELQQTAVFDDEPGGRFASVWQKGAGISADGSGNVYASTGEGSFLAGVDLPVSVFTLAKGTGQLTAADWFTPYNWQSLCTNDLDLDSAVVLLPLQSGSHPYEAVVVGKQGTIYLLDRTNLGHICTTCTTTDTQIVQELYKAVANTGSPVYWNHTLYFTGGAQVQAYKVSQGLLVTPPAVSASVPGGGNAIITANGTTNGILWDLGGAGVLWAMNAQTLSVLYTSRQAPNGRDTVPPLAHFATPIVADGKVFIGTQNSLVVYGLLP